MRKTALGRDYISGIIVYFQWLRGRTAAVNCRGHSVWFDCFPPPSIGVNVLSLPGLRNVKAPTSKARASLAYVFYRVFKVAGAGYGEEPTLDIAA